MNQVNISTQTSDHERWCGWKDGKAKVRGGAATLHGIVSFQVTEDHWVPLKGEWETVIG